MTTETPLGRVRGLGSARSGGHHWRLERMISAATLLLFIWLIVSLLRLPALAHDNVVEWLSSPLAAVPMLLLIVTTFWHLKMGMQVIIEDYVHDEGNSFLSMLLLNFLTIGAGATALFAVLKIALGGDAN
ncbi:MAG TPA: succinate dehydrogenase, hydrophobic membrane anchor protein [Allosphingosinicella sp.]|nr:succinate dehydrogenase, hydrophobic membrane anchor protein [Allosphingosinicella sp.]